MRPRPLAAIALLLAAGCGEIPQPFRHAGTNPLLDPAPLAAGVLVLPVEGVPAPEEMAEAVAQAFLALQIPAGTRHANSAINVVEGRAEERGGTVELRWTLTGPDGATRATHRWTAGAERLRRDWPRLMKAAAAEVATAFTPLAGAGQAAAPPAPPPRRPRIAVAKPKGAPPQGERAMPPALSALLKRSGFDLAASPAEADFAVEGVFTTKPGPPGTRLLEIVWTVKDRKGRGLGTVEQANPVPIALLEGPWGEMAALIAEGAAEGVVAILRAQDDGNAARGRPFTD